jgi:hypothetical protein
MGAMPNADDAGPFALRIDFPGGAGRTFAGILLPLLAAPVLFYIVRILRSPADTPSRPVKLAVAAVLLTMIVAGFMGTLRLLRRKPTALEVREKSLLLFFGSRVETIEWPTVLAVDQVIVGMVPIHVVHIGSRPMIAIGTGDRAVALAQEIVRRAGLRWIHEPFSAVR